jgi:transposase
MPFDPASLPRDPDRLIDMIVELHDENAKLQAMLETMRRALYGARSERFETDAAQLVSAGAKIPR